MKLLQQFVLVMGLLFASRVIAVLTKIPVPPTILAMILLLLLLETKIFRVEWFEKISEPLLAHITLFLIPPSLAFAGSIGAMSGLWVKTILIVVLSATAIFVVTAKTIEWMMRKEPRDASHHPNR